MCGSPGRLWAFLFSVTAACGWAPFDPSLLEEPPEQTPDEGRRDGRADDGRQSSPPTDEPTDEPTDDPREPDEPDPDDPGEPVDAPQEPDEPLEPTGESEPNDSMRDAQPVGLADVVLAEWTPAGDEDWYVLSLLAGDVVDIRTHADDGGCDFDSIVIVYDELAEPRPAVTSCQDEIPEALCIDDTDGSPCARVTIEVQDDGLYYVRVIEFGADDHALYSIDFERQP
jgi:hypothetical protein